MSELPQQQSRVARSAGWIWLANVAVAILIWQTARQGLTDAAQYPRQPIELIVPFAAGGGTDGYARAMKRAIDEANLLSVPLVIRNRGGAGATIGSRYVKNARPDGYTIMLLHDAILSAKYFNTVEYGPEAFTPIAATGQVGMFIAVDVDSPYQTLDDLLTAVARQPETITFGVNLGALTHLAALQLESVSHGGRFLNTPTGGGAERYADLIGGHIQVTGFSAEEFVRFRPDVESGGDRLRGLAYLGPQRHPAATDVPTAREQGFDVINTNTFYWWAPPNTPPERIHVLQQVLAAAVADDSVQALSDSMQIQPLFLADDKLKSMLTDVERRMAKTPFPTSATAIEIGPWILGATGVCLLAVVLRTLFTRRGDAISVTRKLSLGAWQRTLFVTVTVLVYIAVLVSEWIDFRLVTAVFVVAAGSLLTFQWKREMSRLLLTGQLLAFSLHFVMVRLLDVDLP